MGELKNIRDYDYLEYYNESQTLKSNTNFSLAKIKDFLLFFNFSLEDIPKLITFSQNNTKEKNFKKTHKEQFYSLTTKELEIFKLVISGKKSVEIANLLFIETTTVSTHRKHIKQKLGLESMLDCYRYAKSFNIIDF